MKSQRLQSLDYWRGACLVIICIHHLPLSFSGRFTLSSIGFTDSVAAFFFLSGYVSRLAFHAAQVRHGWRAVIGRTARRAALLMGAHVLMVGAAALAIWTHHELWPGETMLAFDARNEAAVAASPWGELVNALTFSQRSWLCHVLPLYVIFVLSAPLLLLWARWNIWSLWAASAALWMSVRLSINIDLGVDMMPDRFWLNPYAWQFVFVSGFVISELIARGKLSMAIRPVFLAAGVLVLVAIGVIRLNAFSWASYLDPILNTKTFCDFSYVAHFALLALVVAGIFPERRFGVLPARRMLATLGKHSLAFWVTSALWAYAAFIAVRAVNWAQRWEDWSVLGLTVAAFFGVSRHWARADARAREARATENIPHRAGWDEAQREVARETSAIK